MESNWGPRSGMGEISHTIPGVSENFTTCMYYVCAQSLSHVHLFATLWTAVLQAPLSKGFSRQEYWNGLPFPTSGDLPNPGIEPKSLGSPVLATDSLPLHHLGSPLHVSPFSKNKERNKNYIEIVQSIKRTLKNRL